MNAWIEHDGKSKPEAEEGTRFDLKFRNGERNIMAGITSLGGGFITTTRMGMTL